MKRILLTLSVALLVATSSSVMAQSSDPFTWKPNENTSIKLGGFIRLAATSDFEGSVTTTDFNVGTIPSSTAITDENQLQLDITSSRVWLDINQMNEALGNIKFYLEADMRGSSNTFRLRQAYVSVKGFTVGQAWSLMSDLAANAPTIDIQGVNSRTFLRTALISYAKPLSEQLTLAASLETNSLTVSDVAGVITSVNQSLPDFVIALQHKSSLGHIKASAVARSLQYGDSDGERTALTGMGGQLSGSLKAASALTLYAQAIYGVGIGRYINDLSSQAVNIVTLDGSQVETLPMGGASLGLNYKINSQWSFAASGSAVKLFSDDEAPLAGYYQNGDYLNAMVSYCPIPKLQLAFELINGGLTRFGADRTSANRASFMLKYTL